MGIVYRYRYRHIGRLRPPHKAFEASRNTITQRLLLFERMSEATDAATVEAILLEVRDHLLLATETPPAVATDDRAKDLGARLLEASKPLRTMSVLAPFLFRDNIAAHHPNDKFSGPEALQVLGFLVALDAPNYLKAASRAVKDEAVRLTASSSSSSDVNVSPELTADC